MYYLTKEIRKYTEMIASDNSCVTDYMSELFEEATELKFVSNELDKSMKVFKL